MDEIRKTFGESVLLEEELEEGNQEGESQTSSHLSILISEKKLTNATAERLNEHLKVSE